jgi:hypothetical protein
MSDAIHQPPETSPPPPESGVPKTFGVLSIIFGAVTGLSNLIGLFPTSANTSFNFTANVNGHDASAEVAQFAEATRATLPYLRIGSALMFVMSAALVIIGVGLLKRKEAARAAALAWSGAGFVVIGIRAWLLQAKIYPLLIPAMNRMTASLMQQASKGAKPPVDVSGLASVMAQGSGYFSLGVLALYPAILLIVLTRPSVKQAFTGE